MSNDLSANMRRSEMWRREDEQRFRGKQLRDRLVSLQAESFESMKNLLDEFAKTQGYLKQNMLDMVKRIGMQEFAVYYERHSTAYNGERN